jgi:hypothetical protein
MLFEALTGHHWIIADVDPTEGRSRRATRMTCPMGYRRKKRPGLTGDRKKRTGQFRLPIISPDLGHR